MIPWRTLAYPLIWPGAIMASCLSFPMLWLLGVPIWVTIAAVAAELAAAAVAARRVRRSRLRLLDVEPRRARELLASPAESSALKPPTSEEVGDLAELLSRRRLVVVVGERSSGRSDLALQAIARDASGFRVLSPRRYVADGRPPLVELLTSGLFPWWGRYRLWLGDLAGWLEAGLDVRIIERWLASGRRRAAVGTITPADLRRLRVAHPRIATALNRAEIYYHQPPGQHLVRESAALRYFRHCRNPDRALVLHAVAMRELLGLAPVGIVCYADAMCVEPTSLEDIVAPLVHRGGSPLMLKDDELVAHPHLLTIVDGKLDSLLDDEQIRRLRRNLSSSELVTVAQTLGARRRYDDAESLLDQAESRQPALELREAIVRVRLWLTEMQFGSSGAALSIKGGFDFFEPMGPRQRQRIRSLQLPPEPDDAFDPRLPNERDGRAARFYRLSTYRAVLRGATLAGLDFGAVAAASIASLAVRATAQGEPHNLISLDLVQLVAPALAVTIAIAVTVGLYRSHAPRARVQPIVGVATVMVTVVAAGLLAFDVSVGTLGALGVLGLVFFALDWLLRWGYDVVSRRWVRARRLQSRALILGPSRDARMWGRNLRKSGRPVQPVAYMSPDKREARERPDRFCVGGYGPAGSEGELPQRIQDLHIDEVLIVDHDLSTKGKAELVNKIHRVGIDVRFVSNADEVSLGDAGRSHEDDGLVLTPAALMSPEKLEMKRVFDLAVVTVTIPLWSMFMLAYAIYTWIMRPGQPVFVAVDRVGIGETGFSMIRLRTRKWWPDGRRGIHPCGRVEKLLELSGLDELPQVFNVLRGEMSVVGPRPLAVDDARNLKVDERRTLGVRPGMTGRWQVAFAYGASEFEMRALDVFYLRHWRLSSDLELIMRTPVAILRRGGYLGDTKIEKRRRTVAGPAPQGT